jgi:hypothetical protein
MNPQFPEIKTISQSVIDWYIDHINKAIAHVSVDASADTYVSTCAGINAGVAHVIFEHGTVLMLDHIPLPTDALPFTRAYIDSWPIGRLAAPDDLPEHIAESAVNYTQACGKWGTAHAYAGTIGLISAGYPDAATRTVSTTADGHLHIIAYPTESTQLVNILDGQISHETALSVGLECRRLDWMFPKIVEIILLEYK